MSSSKIQELAAEECELDLTSMIDVTFLLIIFFICTLKFKTLEGKLSAYLPKDVGVNTSQAEPIEKVEIMLNVVSEGTRMDPDPKKNQPWKGEGRYRWVDRKLAYQVGAIKFSNVDELEQRLETLHDQTPDRPATIDARKGTIYGDVVPVLDAAIRAGFTEITFVGEYK